MYKERKETTHEGVGERKTYININKKISTMYVYKWSQDLVYKSNVSKRKEKKRKDTYYPHYIPQNVSKLPLTKWSYTNSRYILSSLHPSKCVKTPPNKMVLY